MDCNTVLLVQCAANDRLQWIFDALLLKSGLAEPANYNNDADLHLKRGDLSWSIREVQICPN